MINFLKNKSIKKTKTTNDEYDELCLICMDVNGSIILCSECKFVYCTDCAIKINNLCSICFRLNNSNNVSNQNNLDYYSYYDDINFEPQFSYSFTFMISIIINVIIGISWIFFAIFFGYILSIFIFNLIKNLIYFLMNI